MLSAWILGSVLVAAGPSTDEADAAYQAAKAQVGRDPQAQIKLALWCEAHGLDAERLKHLAMAVLADPTNSTARGLLGLVSFQGRWQKPEAVAERIRNDQELARTLAEYNDRRARAANTADAQWELALWCEQKGLKAEAFAHLATVVRLDPGREAAWKHLGYRKHNGRWVTDEQLAAAKAEVEAQKKADRHWKPLLEKWKTWLGEKSKKDEAKKLLATVIDPRAVPSILQVFVGGDQARAIQLLGQIDAPAASRALAVLALIGKTADVRRKATESLKGRDVREYADILVGRLRDKIKFEVRPVGGPGSPGMLFVEGKPFNVQRMYAPPPGPAVSPRPGDFLGYDAYGLPVINRLAGYQTATPRTTADVILGAIDRTEANIQNLNQAMLTALATSPQLQSPLSQQAGASFIAALHKADWNEYGPARAQIIEAQKREKIPFSSMGFSIVNTSVGYAQIPVGQMAAEAQKSAAVAKQQLDRDAAEIAKANEEIGRANSRIAQVLNEATDQDLPADRETWKAWWIDQLGYRNYTPVAPPVPTVVQIVPLAYVPQPIPVVFQPVSRFTQLIRMSCFGAGTPVQTLSGLRPIESLQVGDEVLTQDARSGALSYQPILVVHHNPPSKTFKITLGDEVIVSSPFHRFWRAGKGWIMARDLKPGDVIRTVEGLAKVSAFEEGDVQPVFNLDVAQTATFFVGTQGLLVHDNSLPSPGLAPFDVELQLSALTTARAD